jgi:RimJ/RimL family protein N-acetyltransferase
MPNRVPYDGRFLSASFEWFKDEEIRALTMTPPVTREGQAAWFRSLPLKRDYLIWGVEHEGRPIGAFGLKTVTTSDAEYWGYIGVKDQWGTGVGRWMLTEAMDLATGHGLQRLYLKVIEHNERAIRLYRRFGFEESKYENGVILMEKHLSSSD